MKRCAGFNGFFEYSSIKFNAQAMSVWCVVAHLVVRFETPCPLGAVSVRLLEADMIVFGINFLNTIQIGA
jgi:hypothetical protein